MTSALTIRDLGMMDYQTVWHAMQKFTDKRTELEDDEIWLVEHPAIFTQGQTGNAQHLLAPGDIPVIKVDRGGQVTYHGPGQLIAYILLNIRRRSLGVRQLVTLMENAIIATLADIQITAVAKPNAPGVYTQGKKIASLGLRIRRGCSFHGLALNIDMDLTPFSRINPCGFPDLKMTQCKNLSPNYSYQTIKQLLIRHLSESLTATDISFTEGLRQPYE